MNSKISSEIVHPKGKYFICMLEPEYGQFLLEKLHHDSWFSSGVSCPARTRYKPDGTVDYELLETKIWYFDSLDAAIIVIKRFQWEWRREEYIYKVTRNGLRRVRCGKTIKNDWEK